MSAEPVDPPFDLLGSASFLVEDRLVTAEALVGALGFPPPKPRWHVDARALGLSVTFMRPMLDSAWCPTPIELVQVHEPDPATPGDQQQIQIGAIGRSQGARPTRVHATDVAAREPQESIDRLERLSVPHWVHRSPDGVPRVWIGVDPLDRTRYDPGFDAHLHIEVLPTSVLGLPPAAFDPSPFDPRATAPGTMVRVVWRTFLVRDLTGTLAVVERLLGWSPEGPVDTAADGSTRARLGFRLPTSTRLELLQPAEGSEEHAALEQWGEGPWSMTIGVHGLGAKAEDLDRRGTPYRWVETGFSSPGRVVRVDRAATPGCAFDLAELEDPPGR